MKRAALAGGLALAFLAAGLALAAPKFPPLTGRVVDAANVLPASTEAKLDAKLAALERDTGRQLVVATIPSLQGYEIEEYGYQLGRAWGLGEAKRDDGALLIVAPKERKVRVEVGYGLEGVLTDAVSSKIIQQDILPKFRSGDLPEGVEDGEAAIEAVLRLDPAAAQAAAEETAASAAKPRPGKPGAWVTGMFFLFLFLIVVANGIFGRRMRRRRRGGGGWIAPLIVGSLINSGNWKTRGWGSGGWSSGGGSSGGGGGFSGGGGSFGGGGASGSW